MKSMREKVLDVLNESNMDPNLDYDEFITKIKNKKSEQLIYDLYHVEPSEEGGRVALTGFYYQFLVFLDYWIKMLQGEWDFVALELHEDIVVGKNDTMRFIQVKSSKETEQYTSATLTKRKKVSDDNKNKIITNNSWIEKLISKAKFFKKDDGYKTEFELITSFYIMGSAKMEINKFRKDFPNVVNEDDDLVKFLQEDTFNRDGSKVNYEEECGEKISELLSRFCITKKMDIQEIDYYEAKIIKSLCDVLGEGAQLTDEDLMMLIGRLMKMCQLYQDKMMLYISEDESNMLIQTLEDNANRRAEKRVQLKGTQELLDDVFVDMSQPLRNIDLYHELSKYIMSYKEYLGEWVESGEGSFRELINRYLDGNKYSIVHKMEPIGIQKGRLLALIKANILLIIAFSDVTKFSGKYKSLLVKEIKDKSIGFLSLNYGDPISKGIDKTKYILTNSEDIKLLLNPPKTIIQGEFNGSMDKPILIELDSSDLYVDGLPNDKTLDEANGILHIIPGGVIELEFKMLYTYSNIDDLKEKLTSLWGGII